MRPTDSLKAEVKPITMGLRECIMLYFKGTCIERLTTSDNIARIQLSNYRSTNFRYQRQHQDEIQDTLYTLKGIPVFTLSHVPDRVIFHEGPLMRSPQLREVYAQLQKFMEQYLGGVKVETNKEAVLYA